MRNNCFGWAGKIAVIDLGTRKISILDTEDYSERFLGGMGIAEKLYWDMSSAANSSFHPSNPLIFMTGPLAATTAPAASRLVVCAKSPSIYPETFVPASLGGFFAAVLKKAGFDGVVVHGKAEEPVYVSITDHCVSIKDARHVWGFTNTRTREVIAQELGGKASMLSIGPGGEHGSRIGTIFTDIAGNASMGFGSVMGSKNLKAIAVQGTGKIQVAHPDRIRTIRKKFKEMRGDGFFNLFGTPLTTPAVSVEKKVLCHGCPQGCWRSEYSSLSGERGVRKCHTGMFYSMWDKQFNGSYTDGSFRAMTVVNDNSLCILELVFIIVWLSLCFKQGILTEKQAELPLSKIGSMDFLEKLIRKISFREGFGEVLSQGAFRASKIVGSASHQIASSFLTQTGRAVAYGPKVFIPSAMLYATEPRPLITGLHEVCEPLVKWALWYTSHGEKSYVSTEVLRKIGAAFWGSEQAVDFSTYDGKALAAVNVQNRQYLKESLILCDFSWPVYDDASTRDHVGDPSLERQLFNAVTGQDCDEKQWIGVSSKPCAMSITNFVVGMCRPVC